MEKVLKGSSRRREEKGDIFDLTARPLAHKSPFFNRRAGGELYFLMSVLPADKQIFDVTKIVHCVRLRSLCEIKSELNSMYLIIELEN